MWPRSFDRHPYGRRSYSLSVGELVSIWEGNTVTEPADQGKAASDWQHQPVFVLSDIERLVLRLHAEGHTTMGIALAAGYSERHVRRLTRRICARLGAGSCNELSGSVLVDLERGSEPSERLGGLPTVAPSKLTSTWSRPSEAWNSSTTSGQSPV